MSKIGHTARSTIFIPATSGGSSWLPSGAGAGAPITTLTTPPAADVERGGEDHHGPIATAVDEGSTSTPRPRR